MDGKDYLVTFGGTSEHCEPLTGLCGSLPTRQVMSDPELEPSNGAFGPGGILADMRGYQLDLSTMQWHRGPSSDLPAPRLRFGVARWGRHLIIHGGLEPISNVWPIPSRSTSESASEEVRQQGRSLNIDKTFFRPCTPELQHAIWEAYGAPSTKQLRIALTTTR